MFPRNGDAPGTCRRRHVITSVCHGTRDKSGTLPLSLRRGLPFVWRLVICAVVITATEPKLLIGELKTTPLSEVGDY